MELLDEFRRLRKLERADPSLWLRGGSQAGLEALLRAWPQFLVARCLLAASAYIVSSDEEADRQLGRSAVDVEGWTRGRRRLLGRGAQLDGPARENALLQMQRWWPKEPLFPYVLGVLLQQRHALTEAIVALTRAIALAPGAFNPSFALAQTLQRANMHELAEPLYARQVASFPDVSMARVFHGDILLELSRYREAIEVLTPLAQTSADFSLYRCLARAHEHLEDYPQAHVWLARAHALRPQDVETLAAMGYVHMATERYELALARYEQALALDRGDAILQLDRGRALRGMGRDDDALQAFIEAVEAHPADARAHYWLARCHEDAGAVAAAEQEHRTAVQLDPSMCEAVGWLLASLREQGREGEVPELMQGVELSGERGAYTWAQASAVAGLAGELATSLQYLERALDLDPDCEAAWTMYVSQTGWLDLSADQLAAFVRFAASHTESYATQFKLADALHKAGEVTDALEAAQRVIALAQQNPARLALSCHLLALCYRDADRFPEMAETLERALIAEPDNVYVLADFGACLLACGRNEEARAMLLRALAANPEDEASRAKLAMLP